MMLEHGGGLHRAARRFGIPAECWLDLSTGINPRGWPAPPLPPDCWRRLPEDDDGLLAAARDYYGCSSLVAVAGSQQAIMALPRLRPRCRVAMLSPAYAEHEAAWIAAGHRVAPIGVDDIDAVIEDIDVLLLIHPNNPTGQRFERDRLLAWQARLAARGGWLVVDEAFIDADPAASLADVCGREGLVVLRSLGKFFGLAGARVGFVLGPKPLLDALAEYLGPWPIAHPSRHVAIGALRDEAWQRATRERLRRDGRRLADLLSRHGLAPSGGCELFQWLRHARARYLAEELAWRAVLVRGFDHPASLRLGLPDGEADWQRLDDAIGRARRQVERS